MLSIGSGDLPAAVALLMEGVDRNRVRYFDMRGAKVALLMEGVDRNILCSQLFGTI